MKHSHGSLLRNTFRVGITLKGIDGFFEIIGSLLLWFKVSSVNRVVQIVCERELSRGSHDFLFNHLSAASQKLASGSVAFASFYLLSHGLVKVVLVVLLWLNKLWAYPLTIVIFSVFVSYEIYRLIHTHSLPLAVFTLFDILIVVLAWKEFQAQKAVSKTKG